MHLRKAVAHPQLLLAPALTAQEGRIAQIRRQRRTSQNDRDQGHRRRSWRHRPSLSTAITLPPNFPQHTQPTPSPHTGRRGGRPPPHQLHSSNPKNQLRNRPNRLPARRGLQHQAPAALLQDDGRNWRSLQPRHILGSQRRVLDAARLLSCASGRQLLRLHETAFY